MSLNYNLTQVENRDTSDEGWGVTQAVIFSTMSTGIGDLTEANVPEFYARQKLAAELGGYTPLTLQQVRDHVGLKTNVFPQESRTKWLKRIAGGALDDAVRHAKIQVGA